MRLKQFDNDHMNSAFNQGYNKAIEEVEKIIDDVYYIPVFDRKRTKTFNQFIKILKQKLKEKKENE